MFRVPGCVLPKLRSSVSLKLNRFYADCYSLTLENMNPNIIKLEYAVRGPLVIRAGDIEKELKSGTKKPFTEVIRANIGDCHAMGQHPITFIRQVLALVSYPPLIETVKWNDDVKRRAKEILANCRGNSVGSYTDSPGIEYIRRLIADYIAKRDGGIKSDWQDIMIAAGASEAIKNVLKLIISPTGKPAGVMIPIPQYPLYTAALAEFGMEPIRYYLDEDKNWGLDLNDLEKSIKGATSNPKALVVINPGNPTGQVLTKENIQGIIKFAHKYKLLLLCDEVYQHNIWAPGSEFHSFKKVLMEMGDPYKKMEMASFMSCSKGYMGECGLRGGYSELVNICEPVKAMYLKAISANLCATVLGQTVLACVANPPDENEPSYGEYKKERDAILLSLKQRAVMVEETFNKMEGFKCNTAQGAMYSFPRFEIPPKAIEAAKKAKRTPDGFYCFELLENTGICVIPGSGFGQKEGTYHIRTTILPQPNLLKAMLEKFHGFHKEFLKKYK